MQVRESYISFALLLGLLVLAQWIWGEPAGPLWYFKWAAYLVGGILAFSIVGSALAGLFHLVGWVSGRKERARQARMVKTDAQFFSVDDAGGHGPYNFCRIVVVPALGVVDLEFRDFRTPSAEAQSAMRAIVNEGVERIKREAAPAAWVEALPPALAALREHGFALSAPTAGIYWYDPPEEPKAPRS